MGVNATRRSGLRRVMLRGHLARTPSALLRKPVLAMLGILLGMGLPGCAPPADKGVNAACAPLYYGGEDAGLPLDARQQAAIGAIATTGGDIVCTGTMIAPGWVLTAKHCNEDGALFFLTGEGSIPDVSVTVGRRLEHSESELMLVALEVTAELRALAVRPIRVSATPLELGWDSEMATAAGFGERHDGGRGRREFIREPVVEITPGYATIDGQGESGACGGDSGGPLLIAREGEVVVSGVLDSGAVSCLGLDRFARADAWLDWIEEESGPQPPSGGCPRATQD